MTTFHHKMLFSTLVSIFIVGCGGQAHFSARKAAPADDANGSENAEAATLPTDDSPVGSSDDSTAKDPGDQVDVNVSIGDDAAAAKDGENDGATPIPNDNSEVDVVVDTDASGNPSGSDTETDPSQPGSTGTSGSPNNTTNNTSSTPSPNSDSDTASNPASSDSDSNSPTTPSPLGPVTVPSSEGTESPEMAAVRSQCAKESGMPSAAIKIAGNKANETLKLSPTNILAIRITGNEPKVSITVPSGERAKIAGLCIFVAGNRASLDMTLGIEVGRLVYRGTGNQTVGTIDVIREGSIEDMVIKMTGNQSHLTLKGDGHYTCGGANLKGHKTKFNCGG